MAFVHPSRAGLVPQDPIRREEDRYERRRGRSRSRTPPRRERHDDSRSGRGRRSSPSYGDYKRPQTPPRRPVDENAPLRAEERMYGARNSGGPAFRRQEDSRPTNGGYKGGYRGTGGTDWLESRRRQREASTKSIWPPSPKASRDESPHDKRSRHKRSRSTHSSDSSPDSDSDDRSKRRKHSRKDERDRDRHHRSSKSSKSKHRHRSSRHRSSRRHSPDSSSASSEYEDDRRRRRSRSRTPTRKRSETTELPSELPSGDDDDEWVEAAPDFKNAKAVAISHPVTNTANDSRPVTAPQPQLEDLALDDLAEEIGPMPLPQTADGRLDERAYGSALLRGEGSAMAAFVQNNERIPRRGEIGLTCDQIETFETSGYVMSGSRHRRMNAVRMRKENQVISAEEKRGILKMQKEEKDKRENLIIGGFREILEDRLKDTGKK